MTIKTGNKKTATAIKTVVEKLIKLCSQSKRGFLFSWEDQTGFHEIGTRNMLEKFRSHDVESWSRAASLDTLLLNSVEDSDVM